MDNPGFVFRHGLRIFLFSKTLGRALRPTQPIIEWVPELIPGVNRTGRDFENSPSLIAQFKNEWSHVSISPIRFHGVYGVSFTFIQRQLVICCFPTRSKHSIDVDVSNCPYVHVDCCCCLSLFIVRKVSELFRYADNSSICNANRLNA